MYNSSSIIPLTGSERATDFLLMCSYVTLSLPYMYRSVDTGLRTIDIRTLTEAAEVLGANTATILFKVIFPNITSAILSGAFLTFAVVIGEFTMGFWFWTESGLDSKSFARTINNQGSGD